MRTAVSVLAFIALGCAAPVVSPVVSPEDDTRVRARLWAEHAARVRAERAAEFEARVIELDGKRMPFAYSVHGVAPPAGHALFVSLHGGGSAPKEVNDQQWENQKRLYAPAEGIYVAPRAPTDAWNMWHQAHMGAFLDRLIEDFVVFEGVDPDRVYLTGYSAGGDGVYQL
ncbi:MAG TPA: hypothetical protein ENJ09_07485, partial [Planctomycetes bacterium]|nr:hypothetical protein [Planctomycetota bacterium]